VFTRRRYDFIKVRGAVKVAKCKKKKKIKKIKELKCLQMADGARGVLVLLLAVRVAAMALQNAFGPAPTPLR
jgi:hypothetical protein